MKKMFLKLHALRRRIHNWLFPTDEPDKEVLMEYKSQLEKEANKKC